MIVEVLQKNDKTNEFSNISYLLKKMKISTRFLKVWLFILVFFSCAQSNLFSQTYNISTVKYPAGIITNNTNCLAGAKCGNYNTNMSITGFVTFNQFLSPNLNRASATIIDYRVNDGINTFTPQNSFIDRSVIVTTNANGDLVSLETLFRQWQDPTKNTTGSFLNEIWLFPDFSYVFNAVQIKVRQGAVIRQILLLILVHMLI
jgi:hypothetical protein